MRKSLAEIVVAEALADEARVSAARRHARTSGEPLIAALVEQAQVAETSIIAALARHLRLPMCEAVAEPVEPDALREVGQELAFRHRVLPLTLETRGDGPRVLRVAMPDPTDRDAMAALELTTGCRIDPVLATLSSVDTALRRAFRGVVTAVMHFDDDRTATHHVRPGGKAAEKAAERAEKAAGKRRPFGGDLRVSTPVVPRSAVSGGAGPAPAGGGGPGMGTAPYHSIEDEAPLALRHRALLGVLFDKGLVTEEEYGAAIRRLLEEEADE